MEKAKEQQAWNLAAIILYIAAFGISILVLGTVRIARLTDFGFFDLTVISLATFRLVHLLSYDKIFNFVRESLLDGRGAELRKPQRGVRRAIAELLECLWCTGMWSGLIALTLYLLGIWGQFIVFVFAVAGVGSLLQLISKAISHFEDK